MHSYKSIIMWKKARTVIALLLVLMLIPFSSYNAHALDIGMVTRVTSFLEKLENVDELPDLGSYGLALGNLISGLFCGCRTTDSCEGIIAGICIGVFDIDNEGLRWANSILENPELGLCSLIYQGYAHDVGLSINNSQRDATFQQTPNAYIEAARMHINDEYRYYFSFNFFPTQKYSSSKVTFQVKQGNNYVNLETQVFPEADQGFRHSHTLRTSELYNEACMLFSERPAGFSRDRLCVRVMQV